MIVRLAAWYLNKVLDFGHWLTCPCRWGRDE